MRKGMNTLEALGAMILLLVVVGVAILLIIKGRDTANENLDQLQACKGFVGTLGGKEGGCFSNKQCSEATNTDKESVSASGAYADSGNYFQYIGEGWGCEAPNPYCCIQLPESANPLRATDINRAKCISELQEGEWAVQTGLKCEKVTQGAVVETTVDSQVTFYYKPRSNDSHCRVHVGYSYPNIAQDVRGLVYSHDITTRGANSGNCYTSNNADGVVEISTTPLEYMDSIFARYGQSFRFDRAVLNNPGAFTSELRAGGAAMNAVQFTLSTTNPHNVFYCPLFTSGGNCANYPVNHEPFKDSAVTGTGKCTLVNNGAKCELRG